MAKRYDIEVHKEIHARLLKETHTAFRIQAFRLKLTMHAIVNELVTLVANNDPYIIKRLKELAKRKRDREILALSEMDSDSILDYIEDAQEAEEK